MKRYMVIAKLELEIEMPVEAKSMEAAESMVHECGVAALQEHAHSVELVIEDVYEEPTDGE